LFFDVLYPFPPRHGDEGGRHSEIRERLRSFGKLPFLDTQRICEGVGEKFGCGGFAPDILYAGSVWDVDFGKRAEGVDEPLGEMTPMPSRFHSESLLPSKCFHLGGAGEEFPKWAGVRDEGIDFEVDDQFADLLGTYAGLIQQLEPSFGVRTYAVHWSRLGDHDFPPIEMDNGQVGALDPLDLANSADRYQFSLEQGRAGGRV
jgi:hypothetical protein